MRLSFDKTVALRTAAAADGQPTVSSFFRDGASSADTANSITRNSDPKDRQFDDF